jgi:hypothetical protein
MEPETPRVPWTEKTLLARVKTMKRTYEGLLAA